VITAGSDHGDKDRRIAQRNDASPGDFSADGSPDGQRFLAAVHPEGAQSPTMTLVSNWTATLKK
jgi:hypothetical protein